MGSEMCIRDRDVAKANAANPPTMNNSTAAVNAAAPTPRNVARYCWIASAAGSGRIIAPLISEQGSQVTVNAARAVETRKREKVITSTDVAISKRVGFGDLVMN